MRNDLRSYTLAELSDLFLKEGIPKYRAEQVFRSVHNRYSGSIEEIAGIPKELKVFLNNYFRISLLTKTAETESHKDKTKKVLFETTDVNLKKVSIESVHIPDENRNTFCISTQAGCNVGCGFCATGKMNLNRNLTSGEIVSQVYQMINITDVFPSNVVYMGMGEPLLNYENVLRSLIILTDKRGLGISSKRITVSTVGFMNRIKKLADDIKNNPALSNVKLAFSLHSTDNGFRESLIPTGKINNLKKMYEEIVYFYRVTGNKITYEYIYFEGLNDTEYDINRLVKLSRMVPCNINIIPFHPVDFELTEPIKELNEKNQEKINLSKENSLSNSNKIYNFTEILRSKKVAVNIRASSGVDINAACGQLAVKKIL